MKRLLILSTLLLCLSIPANAHTWERIGVQKNDSLSLSKCIEMAIFNAGAVRRAYMNYEMATNSVGIAKSAYIPTLSAGIGLNVTDNNHANRGVTSRTFPSVSATLNQLIWDFGKTNALIRMSKFNKIMAKFQLEALLCDIIYETQTAYYGVLASKSYVDVEKANVQINHRDYNRTKAFFDEGLVSKIDLVNQEVYLSDAKIGLINAENLYQNSIVNLNNAMYVVNAPEYNIENTETFNFKSNYAEVNLLNVANTTTKEDGTVEPKDAVLSTQVEKTDILENYKFEKYPYTLEESVERAYANRPDLLSMQATQNAVEEALKYTKKSYLPDLTGSVGYNWNNNTNYSTNGVSVGAYLSMNNLNIMDTKLRIKESKAQLTIAEQNVELIKQNIYFDVQNSYINMMQLEKNIPLLQTKVKQTLENYELADARYEVGLGNFIELQDAKENYNNAQRDYVQTIYKYNVALTDLHTAMGEL